MHNQKLNQARRRTTLVQFTCTTELRKALELSGINPSTYGVAFNGESAGLDLFNAGPEIVVPPVIYLKQSTYMEYSHDITEFALDDVPGSLLTLIPTGLKIAVPPYHGGFIFQRGSIRKTPLIHRAGVVDSGFTAEVFISVLNLSTRPFVIPKHAKTVFQLVCMPVISQYCYIDPETYQSTTRLALRKDACLGSTNMPVEPELAVVPGDISTLVM